MRTNQEDQIGSQRSLYSALILLDERGVVYDHLHVDLTSITPSPTIHLTYNGDIILYHLVTLCRIILLRRLGSYLVALEYVMAIVLFCPVASLSAASRSTYSRHTKDDTLVLVVVQNDKAVRGHFHRK